jgi:alkylhydroperoxidase family enzyme
MARINVSELAPEVYRALSRTEAAIRKGSLDPIVRELVKIRAAHAPHRSGTRRAA